VFSQNSAKLYCRDPVVLFLEFDKTCIDIFDTLSRFINDLLENENSCGGAMRSGRKIGTQLLDS